jgi:hypothetical protein
MAQNVCMYHVVVVWNFVWIRALGTHQSERPYPHPTASATAKLFRPYNQTGPMYAPAILLICKHWPVRFLVEMIDYLPKKERKG